MSDIIHIQHEEERSETDFILSKPAFAEELKRRIQSIENREAEFIIVNQEELNILDFKFNH